MRRAIILLGLAMVAMAAFGCATAPEIKTAAFTAADYSFSGPTEVEAGTTEITLQNNGQDIHHFQLIKLGEGKTFQDLMGAMQEQGEAALANSWIEEAGGPSVAGPGQTANATLELEAGNYGIICVIPNAEGTPHVALGMASPLTVTESDEDFADLPEADVEIDMVDFGFEGDVPTEAGETTIKVVNAGQQGHETALVKLAEGKTVQDLMAAFAPDAPPGPPPAQFLGGFQGIAVGGEGTFTADLDAGNYAFVCFIPDVNSGAPHAALGMVREFSIQ